LTARRPRPRRRRCPARRRGQKISLEVDEETVDGTGSSTHSVVGAPVHDEPAAAGGDELLKDFAKVLRNLAKGVFDRGILLLVEVADELVNRLGRLFHLGEAGIDVVALGRVFFVHLQGLLVDVRKLAERRLDLVQPLE
jgi:hypothetical protein